MKFYYYLVFALVLLLTSCDKTASIPTKDFWVDNPTTADINIKIDEAEYNIPANSGVTVNLTAGRHKLSYNKESIDFFVKPNDQGCVINPTLSNYIFHVELYSEMGKEEKAQAEIDKIQSAYLYDFELNNGTVVKVPFKLIKDKLFIEQYQYYWHLGVTEKYKDVTSINKGGSSLSTATQAKLFRENDYLDYIGRENLPEGFSFSSTTKKLSDLEPYQLIADTLTINCEAANDYLAVYRKNFSNLIQADAASYKGAYDTLRYYTRFSQEVEKACSPRYNKQLPEDNNFDEVMLQIGKRLESLGEMNAFVIKD